MVKFLRLILKGVEKYEDHSVLNIDLNPVGRIPKKSEIRFLSPERAATYQPSVDDSLGFSPERALHMQTIKEKSVTPFLRATSLVNFYPSGHSQKKNV